VEFVGVTAVLVAKAVEPVVRSETEAPSSLCHGGWVVVDKLRTWHTASAAVFSFAFTLTLQSVREWHHAKTSPMLMCTLLHACIR
jgi:hypothetical protein